MIETGTTRPNLLRALCILTFIGSTAGFIVYFLASLFFDKAAGLIIEYSNWHTVDSISPFYFTLFMAFSAVSLVGAIRMWKRHRDGFFIYSISQLLMFFLPAIWISWNSVSVTGAIFTIIFIVGYALNLKWLKR